MLRLSSFCKNRTHTQFYWLSGMDDTQIQEASAVTSVVVGFSAYLHGINYSVEQFLRELDETVSYIKSQHQA